MSPISALLWFIFVWFIILAGIITFLLLKLISGLLARVKEVSEDPSVMIARSGMILLKTIGATDLKGMTKEEIGNHVMIKRGADSLAAQAGHAAGQGFRSGGGSGGGGGDDIISKIMQFAEMAPKLMDAISAVKGSAGGLLGGGGGPPKGGVQF